MERFLFWAGVLVLFGTGTVRAQTSLDAIQEDLRAAKTQHDQANSTLMTSFLGALQQASQSAAMALDLYQKAGGSLPDAAPVKNHYEYETPTEKAQRQTIDSQNFQSVAIVIQVHCGLMRNAALLTVSPDDPQVKAQWNAYLKSAAQVYPQLAGPRALKDVAMRNSVVASYLGFHSWGDADPGNWTVSDLPQLYHDQVLQPLRKTPSQDTLDAWDTYIAMRQADEPDRDKWAREEEPALTFDRDSDDFAVQPTMDKLAALDAIIKANPSSDHLDDWLKRMQGMITTYSQGGTGHSPLPGATPGTASSDATGAVPAATPGSSTSEVGATAAAATPGAAPVTTTTSVPGATPGSTSSESAGLTPMATPGAAPVTTSTPLPGATPGSSSAASAGANPAATPGTPTSGSGASLPAASPGTPSSAAPGPLPAATPSTPTSGTTVPPAAP